MDAVCGGHRQRASVQQASNPATPHLIPPEILGPAGVPGFAEILTSDALAFLAELERRFGAQRRALLAQRVERQARIDRGELPDFLVETRSIRESDWTAPALPADLQDRRVEITGPTDRKMVINALNSGANVFMADFEDSLAPTWANLLDGQLNLRDAIRRTIAYTDPGSKKEYRLQEKTAVLLARPRGWHLQEHHLLVDGRPMSASLFDFGLYFFHNVAELRSRGTGVYLYLPKMESHREARLWNDVFNFAEQSLRVPAGTVRATVLIETLLGAFEMEEIIYELRSHMAGLNCGRWDYIFSYIKKLRNHAAFVVPNRGDVTMTTHFLRSYSQLVIKVCHRRGVSAIGGTGMSAFIPVKGDEAANQAAIAKVRADKEREVKDGHDGTWVAHPALVPIARAVFDQHMPTPNQIHRQRPDVNVTAADLLRVPTGPKTEAGLRECAAVALGYIEAWLRGLGCVPLFNLMEDAATAEISRALAWQWLRHGVTLDDGQKVTVPLVRRLIESELDKWRERVGEARFAKSRFVAAANIFRDLVESPTFDEFLTLRIYPHIVTVSHQSRL